ncbi:unnamed protein product [Linum tenue]|uniref:Protein DETOXIFICATION n=1 Tax=Linum tenue TaxID=586396 RepID=A0AAV0MQK5_9ROSI|nr:unnamed protein product [Linum tenue]
MMTFASNDENQNVEETLPLKYAHLGNHICENGGKNDNEITNPKEISKEGKSHRRWSCNEFMAEVKSLRFLAAPLITINLSQYFLLVISLTMVGHIGDQLSLSSSAIAISFASVTGFSPTCGIASALETLCGQAYGAKQYRQFGVRVQTAVFSVNFVCVPISVLWIYMEDLLLLIGQNPLISHEAGQFAICLIPALFAYATLQALVRYFQMQSLTNPLITSSTLTLCFHIILCWVLVFGAGLGSHGAAFAIGISYWFNVILLSLHMFSPECDKTRVPLSMELIQGVGEFFRYAIPSAGMICLEWWSFELLIFMSGLLPDPKLETSVLSLCLATMATVYTIPEGIGAAASTRVSNELGAGNPGAACVSVSASVFLACALALTVSSVMYACRHVLGHVFSNDEEVVEYVTTMAPLICLSVILDSVRVTLSGVARGCGWQNLGAYVNLTAYYICGVPLSAILGFWMQLRGPGLWIGIQIGSLLQNILLIVITCRTDWEKEANKAIERALDRSPAEKWGSKNEGYQLADHCVVVKIDMNCNTDSEK